MKSLYKQFALSVLILFAALTLPEFASAQSFQEKKADQYYERYAYSKAVELYQDLFNRDTKNPKYIQRLAYSYYKMLNYRKALIYYSQLVQIEQIGRAHV